MHCRERLEQPPQTGFSPSHRAFFPRQGSQAIAIFRLFELGSVDGDVLGVMVVSSGGLEAVVESLGNGAKPLRVGGDFRGQIPPPSGLLRDYRGS